MTSSAENRFVYGTVMEAEIKNTSVSIVDMNGLPVFEKCQVPKFKNIGEISN